jgi:hypothetical protein
MDLTLREGYLIKLCMKLYVLVVTNPEVRACNIMGENALFKELFNCTCSLSKE